jgi:tripartite-type tricarboxylate transporter receptor subunit TctC
MFTRSVLPEDAMKMRLPITAIASIASLLAVSVLQATNAIAQDEQFFAGKTVTLYAGMPVGGGVDDEMRLVARHFSKFIPGQPSIVARNMPGAGGVVLGNFLRHNASTDGLTLGMPTRSGFLLSNVVKQSGINYDLADFSYVGGAGSNNVTLWLRKPAGISNLAQLRSAKKEIVIGGLAPRTQSALVPRVLAKYERWPFKVVHGYPGFNEVLIATERGEVDGLLTAGQISRPDMVSSGFLVPVVQTLDELPRVPVLSDVVSDPNAKALLGLLLTPAKIGLPLMGPPNISAGRLALLRESYMRMAADKDYREEAEHRGIPVGRALGGADLHKLVTEQLSTLPESVVKEYLSLLQ